MENKTIREIMSTRLKTLHPKDKLKMAKEYFDTYEIHHIPVQVMDEVRGIISFGDILYLEGLVTNSFDEFIKNKKLETMDVEEVMTKRPYCIEANLRITDALEVMLAKRVNALPVIDNSKLVGIITTRDLLKYMRSTLN